MIAEESNDWNSESDEEHKKESAVEAYFFEALIHNTRMVLKETTLASHCPFSVFQNVRDKTRHAASFPSGGPSSLNIGKIISEWNFFGHDHRFSFLRNESIHFFCFRFRRNEESTLTELLMSDSGRLSTAWHVAE